MLLETIKRCDPLVITATDGASYVVADSIPPKIHEALGQLTPGMPYVDVGERLSLPIENWASCRKRLIVEHACRGVLSSVANCGYLLPNLI